MTRVSTAAGALAFALMAAIQYNDPDAPIWIVFYLLPTLACVLVLAGRESLELEIAVIVVAAAGAAWIAPEVAKEELLTDTESQRELAGLAIVALAMAALLLTARGRRRSAR